MNPELLVWAMGVGLLQGFLHCSGMCGPFVLAFSLSFRKDSDGNLVKASTGQLLRLHLSHNLGRILTFTVLGGFFGALGSFVNTASDATGIQAVAGIVGGTMMVLWAIDEARTGHGAGFMERWSLMRIGPFRNLFRRIMAKKTPGAAFAAGILLGFHPCGLIFAMLVSAAAAGSAVHGSLILLAFGIGTVPSLLSVAALGWFGGSRLKGRKFSYLAATLIAFSGVVFMLRGMAVNGWIPDVSPWLF